MRKKILSYLAGPLRALFKHCLRGFSTQQRNSLACLYNLSPTEPRYEHQASLTVVWFILAHCSLLDSDLVGNSLTGLPAGIFDSLSAMTALYVTTACKKKKRAFPPPPVYPCSSAKHLMEFFFFSPASPSPYFFTLPLASVSSLLSGADCP